MSDMHPAVAGFFDQLTAHMQEFLAVKPDGTAISWTAANAELRPGLVWWSCGISVDPGAFVLAGAPEEDWITLGRAYEAASDESFENDFGGVVRSILATARGNFGAEVECQPGQSEEPADRAISADLEIAFRDGSLKLTMVLTPGLVEALGGEAESAEPAMWPLGDGSNPVDRLLHIEVPVSVSLGRAQMRMKEVLALSSGSIVELEQGLGDRVEIRANNCVIARGEMVAVDGNYGVRILEMVSNQFGVPGPPVNADRRSA